MTTLHVSQITKGLIILVAGPLFQRFRKRCIEFGIERLQPLDPAKLTYGAMTFADVSSTKKLVLFVLFSTPRKRIRMVLPANAPSPSVFCT